MAALPEIGVEGGWQQGNEEDMSTIRNCYCTNCGSSNGETLMLPTKVPSFRELIIMAFYCNDCAFKNSEVTFGGEIQPRGEQITLRVTNESDLNRQIIKSDSCSLSIPELEFEIPPSTQRGTISTIEGILTTAASRLAASQPERLRIGDLDNFYRCKKVIDKLLFYATGKVPDEGDSDNEGDSSNKNSDGKKPFEQFTVIVDDPAGNSFVENPFAPSSDPNMHSKKYYRTATQDMSLGLQPSAAAIEAGTIDDNNPLHKSAANVSATTGKSILIDEKHTARNKNNDTDNDDDNVEDVGRKEVMKFTTVCPNCYRPAETDMCLTDIPHFKEVIIMSLFCELCGYKSNEIKGGGAIPKKGNIITLKITSTDDLEREVLKSDTAGIQIPELDLVLDEGGLDGLYTTVEGLLKKLHDRLREANPFTSGDSSVKQHTDNDPQNISDKTQTFSKPNPTYVRYMEFLESLKAIYCQSDDGDDEDATKPKLKKRDLQTSPVTLIITDPLANSFVGPIPKDAIALSYQAEKDGNNSCYDNYVDKGMEVEEYERTEEQNEILGLNDMRTENYDNEQDQEEQEHQDKKQNYGTDQPVDIPDRIRHLKLRGPDHPHLVAKGPVDNDTTIMGPGSSNFAVPSMGKLSTKNQAATKTATATTSNATDNSSRLNQLLSEFELNDKNFVPMKDEEGYNGSIPGKVFKTGSQGIGYYSDKPLLQIWKEYCDNFSDNKNKHTNNNQ